MIDIEIPRTDVGNAERFARDHADKVRFCHGLNQWLIWNGTHWERDAVGGVYRLAKETVRRLGKDADELEDDEHRRNWMKHALNTEAEPRMRSMMKLAEHEDGIPVLASQLDADPMLFNVLNGTIDLRTGTLREHRREDLITKIAPVTLDFAADCPVWMDFLAYVTAGDLEVIEYLQRAVGYTLTGHTREQVMFMLHGDGANGKTTFLEALRHVFGDYAAATDFNSLMVTKSSGPRNDLAKLQGARFVTATESDEGARMAEPVVKQLTGNDVISVRPLYKEFFEYTPQCKFWLAMNHLPTIRGTDHAIWRRIHLIPFDVRVPDEDRDRELLDKLKPEASGILAWALRGLAAYQAEGLKEPDVVKEASRQYRNDQDVVARFLKERCIMDGTAITPGQSLYAELKRWAAEGKEGPLTQKAFSQSLAQYPNLKKCRGGAGNTMWMGLRLADEGICKAGGEVMVN